MKTCLFTSLLLVSTIVSLARQPLIVEKLTPLPVYDSLFNARYSRLDKAGDSMLSPIYGKDWKKIPIPVGNKVPVDMLLGERTINGSGTVRLSDYKGKLVILDIWATSCGSCLAQMPHMQKLQEQFGDKIQIILLNNWETAGQINKRMPKDFKFPNLPVVVGADSLKVLFMSTGVPYHIWIDSARVVRVAGTYANTYAQKIRQLLEGKPIRNLASETFVPNFNRDISYFNLLGREIDNKKYNSIFSFFNPYYATRSGAAINMIDVEQDTRRNTYINQTMEHLLNEVYRSKLADLRIAYSPHKGEIVYNINDTVKVSDKFLGGKQRVDSQWLKGRYCYEIISPIKENEMGSRIRMANDLSRICQTQLNIKVSLDSILTNAKIMVWAETTDEVRQFKDRINKEKKDTFELDGLEVVRLPGFTLLEAVRAMYPIGKQHLFDEELKNKYYLLDYTDDERIPNLVMPRIMTLKNLKYILTKQGYDLIEKQIKRPLLVLSDIPKNVVPTMAAAHGATLPDQQTNK